MIEITADDERVFLKILEDRNNQMLTIIHQYTNYSILTLSAIWALLGKAYLDSYLKGTPDQLLLFLPMSLSVIVILSWRFYARIIDDDIAQNYIRIIHYERVLSYTNDTVSQYSTLYNVIKKCHLLDEILKTNHKTRYSEQEAIVEKLIKNRRIGDRGHFGFDFISSVIIIILLYADTIIFFQSFYPNFGDSKCLYGSVFLFCVLAIVLTIILLLFNPNNSVPIQLNPREKQIERILHNEPIYTEYDPAIVAIVCLFILTIATIFLGIVLDSFNLI